MSNSKLIAMTIFQSNRKLYLLNYYHNNQCHNNHYN
ncbi:hypothetical protein [Salmonella enterica]